MNTAHLLILRARVLQAAPSPSTPPREAACSLDHPASSEDEDGMLALQPSVAKAEAGKNEVQAVALAQVQEELSTAKLEQVCSSALALCVP